jgi:2-iminoacetate synthase ThiH
MSSLFDLASRVAAGRQLADEDARQLAATTDLATVGIVAAEARRVHGGDSVTFVRVAEFACGETLPDAGFPAAAGEVRITGVPPSVDEAVATVRACVSAGAAVAGRVITGFALADLWTLAGGNAAALRDLASALRDAGLSAVSDVALDLDGRLSWPQIEEALAVVTTAGLAAPVGRWDTTPADPVAALKAVRELQAKTRAFQAFAPLPRTAETEPPQTGYDGVKLVALARVMLDNVPAIQVDWIRHGPKLAQVALLFGASDLDRVSPSDDSPLGHRRAPLEEVQRNITAAFLKPLERDGRFEKVTR